MSYTTLQNYCKANTLAEQISNSKPEYTPSGALKKVLRVLRRAYKPSSTGKFVINPEQKVKTKKSHKLTENHPGCAESDEECASLSESTLTICSTLSEEEWENELNVQSEWAVVGIRNH